MEVKEFDRAIVRNLGEEARKLLVPLAKQYGLTVRQGSGRFDTLKFTTKFEFVIADKALVAENAKKTWDTYAEFLGLSKDDFGKTVMLAGKPYKVVGLKANAHKNNVIIERNGKRYVCRPSFLPSYKSIGTQVMEISSKDVGTLNVKDLMDEAEWEAKVS